MKEFSNDVKDQSNPPHRIMKLKEHYPTHVKSRETPVSLSIARLLTKRQACS